MGTLPTWFRGSIDCKSKNDRDFSLVQIAIRNDPNLDANPLRQTCTILSFTTVTLIGERVTHVLELGCVIGHKQIFLSNIAELLSEL